MPRKSPFKRHRFPREIILCAIRWYLRYPLSYQDVVDLLEERGIAVDRSTVFRWVQKFSPELTKRTERHLRRASIDWHVGECPIFCVIAIWSMLPERSKDDDHIQGTAGRTTEGLRAA